MGKIQKINIYSDGTYSLGSAVLRDKWIEEKGGEFVTMVNRDTIFTPQSRDFDTLTALVEAKAPDQVHPRNDVRRQVVAFFNDPVAITSEHLSEEMAAKIRHEAQVLDQVTRMKVVQSDAVSVDHKETSAWVFLMVAGGAVAMALFVGSIIGLSIFFG